MRRRGTALRTLAELIERLESRSVRTEAGCLELPYTRNNQGYPLVSRPDRSPVPAGRLILEHYQGPPKDGQECSHACHNPACIEHTHLRWASHRANMLESAAARRLPGGQPRFTPAEVRMVFHLHRKGEAPKQIACLLGMAAMTVHRLLARPEPLLA